MNYDAAYKEISHHVVIMNGEIYWMLLVTTADILGGKKGFEVMRYPRNS